MRIIIIGAGSLGLLFGAKLFTVCEHITMVARTKEQAEALREQGIYLDGRQVVSPSAAHMEYDSYIEGRRCLETNPDFIFLMVKQPAINDELIECVRSRMSPKTMLVSFQNGIGHTDKLANRIGIDKLLIAVTTEAAKKEAATAVTHTGQGLTYIGAISKENQPSELTQFLFQDLLKSAGFEAVVSNEIQKRIWGKLIINSVINPLTAILRVRNGDLLSSPWAQSLMRDLYEEALLVAESHGIVLPNHLWETLQHVCQATALNHSSMLQDLMNGKNTEIDSMNGSLLRMAEKKNLKLNAHQIVYRFVKALE